MIPCFYLYMTIKVRGQRQGVDHPMKQGPLHYLISEQLVPDRNKPLRFFNVMTLFLLNLEYNMEYYKIQRVHDHRLQELQLFLKFKVVFLCLNIALEVEKVAKCMPYLKYFQLQRYFFYIFKLNNAISSSSKYRTRL